MKELQIPMLVLACTSIIALLWTERIYRQDLWLYRKFGLTELADRWEKRMSWWLPISRIVIAVIAVAAVVMLFIAGRNG